VRDKKEPSAFPTENFSGKPEDRGSSFLKRRKYTKAWTQERKTGSWRANQSTPNMT
jgi:hypothetical protein